MKKIIVIPVVVVVIGFILFCYSRQTGYVKLETPGVAVNLRGLHGVFWKNLQLDPSPDPVRILSANILHCMEALP